MGLLDLPPELLLYQFTFLSLSSLVNLTAVSGSLNLFVNRYSTPLYRAAVINQGFDIATTGPDSGIYAGRDLAVIIKDERQHVKELQELLKKQRALGEWFEGVDSWKAFARKRKELERNWNEARYQQEWFKPSRNYEVWRFKVDTRTNPPHIVSSGSHDVWGGFVEAYNYRTSELIWRAGPVSRYAHIELTEGYIITSGVDGFVLIWRRNDLPPPPPSSTKTKTTTTTQTSLAYSSSSSFSPSPPPGPSSPQSLSRFPPQTTNLYVPHLRFRTPTPSFCSKARYPNLVIGSTHSQKIYIYDVRDGEIVEEMNLRNLIEENDGEERRSVRTFVHMGYIELSDKEVFLCGTDFVHVFKRRVPYRSDQQLESERQRGDDDDDSVRKEKDNDPLSSPQHLNESNSNNPNAGGQQQQQRQRAWTSSSTQNDPQSATILLGRFPPVPSSSSSPFLPNPSPSLNHDIANFGDVGWVACHHWRSHFLAASSEFLLWTPDLVGTMNDPSEARKKVVLLRTGGAAITNLSVENGRAVFSIEDHDGDNRYQGLYLLHLSQPWDSLEEFKTFNPTLKTLSLTLSDGSQASISRMEMTSDAVLATIYSNTHEEILDPILRYTFPINDSFWVDLGDHELFPAWKEENDPLPDFEQTTSPPTTSELPQGVSDSILCHSFGFERVK